MNVIGIASEFLTGLGKQAVMWTVGITISAFIANKIRVFISSFTTCIVSKLKSEISNIQDENLREVARHVVKYVASQFPDVSNSDKMQMAIKKVQEMTPNIIVTDDKVKVLIESAYVDLKTQLKSI